MVLKSPAEPLGSPPDGAIAGVAHVNGEAPALAGLGSASADTDRKSRESTHIVVRAGRRLGAVASRHRGPLTVLGTLLAVGMFVFVLAGRWGQFASAATGAPWWALTAAA